MKKILLFLLLAPALAFSQSFEQADSIGLVQLDSMVQLYFEWRQETGGVNAVYTEPLDSATAANFAFNVAIQANNILYQAFQLQSQSRRISRFTNNASGIIQRLTGLNYRQRGEQTFISSLTPACNQEGVCEGFYTLKTTGAADRILRIRNNGGVREVNQNGNNTADGLQGTVRFLAGMNRFEIAFTAGNLTGQTVVFNSVLANRIRARWSAIDAGGDRLFLLVERKNLGDTQANALGK